MFKPKTVLVHERRRSDGSFLGEIQLNRPEALNAMDLAMACRIEGALKKWLSDPKIAIVFIHSSSERAFSSGGDIKALFYGIEKARADGEDPSISASPLFEREYRLNWLLDSYDKPVIAFGQGIVMGGGFGLFARSNCPIAAESLQLAMPEVRIGFFPDVASCHIFSRMRHPAGGFMALTGASINGPEARRLGLAKALAAGGRKREILQFLLDKPDIGRSDIQASSLSKELEERFPPDKEALPDDRIEGESAAALDFLAPPASLSEIAGFMRRLAKESQNPLLSQGAKAFLKASPLSLHITRELLQKEKGQTLKEALCMEMALALQFARGHNFREGIRALLIDKTKKPRWEPGKLEDVRESHIKACFAPLSGSWANPLLSLPGE